jgi:hypothetical protein
MVHAIKNCGNARNVRGYLFIKKRGFKVIVPSSVMTGSALAVRQVSGRIFPFFEILRKARPITCCNKLLLYNSLDKVRACSLTFAALAFGSQNIK